MWDWLQPSLLLVGLAAILAALVPPIAAFFTRKSDEVDLRPPLQRPPRHRGRARKFTNPKSQKPNTRN